MRKLIVAAMISLDGVIQAPGGPDEDRSDGFPFGGWVVPYAGGDEGVMDGVFDRPFDLVLGRRTYDIFAGYWPHVPADSPAQAIARPFNATAKHVATHHADSLDWNNSHALGNDVVAALRKLKQQDGPDLVTQGSSALVKQLLASDVVDELSLLVYPVLLGRGKRLFDEAGQPSAFRLDHSRTTREGVLISRYLRAGPVQTGSFEL